MTGMGKGTLAVIAGLVLVAVIFGWRMFGGEDASETPEAETAGQSLPPTLEELAERAEADPDNALGWQELGLNLYRANRFAKAADAYARAVEADPESAVLWSSLGEARLMASQDDPMPAAAAEAFRRAIAIDASDARARYFLAVEKDLGGDHEGAITDWLALLADTPPGAPWEQDLVRTIQQVGQINEIAVEERIASAASTRNILPQSAPGAPPGPTREQVAAAAAMSPSQQQDMAEGMVARLAERIEAQGGSVQEWIMLMRSYRQMGRVGEARRTRDRAIAAHPSARSEIEAAAESLQIG